MICNVQLCTFSLTFLYLSSKFDNLCKACFNYLIRSWWPLRLCSADVTYHQVIWKGGYESNSGLFQGTIQSFFGWIEKAQRTCIMIGNIEIRFLPITCYTCYIRVKF
jgi:hypothetical protein